MDSVTEKTNILKSDRLELARQLQEIEFMKHFLAAQSEGSNALEFLKLNEGHDLLKAQILEQEKALTQISTDITVNNQLQVKTTNYKSSL